MTYDFNCGAIAEANNRSPGNVQQHLQFNVFRKVTHLAAWDNRCKMEGKHNDRDTFAGNYFSSVREGRRNYGKVFKDDVS